MISEDPIIGIGRSCMVVGRAATGIYLILKEHKIEGAEVIVPANLCYAAIFPVLYAGGKPRFCDVDATSGNITLETFESACTKNTCAAIVPHMYGNPVSEMSEIAEFCRQNHILLIEDCASAMGAQADYSLGAMGDYTVYSMGYSKTLELGGGGLVCSARNLENLECRERQLPPFSETMEKNLSFFSKVYRTIRNSCDDTPLEHAIYRILPDCLKDGFIYKILDKEKERLLIGLNALPERIEMRREMLLEYERHLTQCQFQRYHYAEGAVPWRMNFLIEPVLRKRLISEMLKRNLPVSDWYPRVTPIFGDHGFYPGTEWHEQHIVNFPIPEKLAVVEQICTVLTEISQEAIEKSELR